MDENSITAIITQRLDAAKDEARELIDKAGYVIETVEAWLSTWNEKD